MRTFLKVLAVLAIVAVGAIIMLTFAGVYVARRIHVNESGAGDNKTVKIESPFGALTVHEHTKLNPETVGIPIYPGASRSDHEGGADFQIDSGDLHKDVSVAGATFYTDDSIDQVRDYYRQKFPDWNTHWNNGVLSIDARDGDRRRWISIQRQDDRTRINVAVLGPPAAN